MTSLNKAVLIPALASIILFSAFTAVSFMEEAYAKQDKVTICHKPGTPAEQTLEIAEPALKAHLKHGDYEGPCVVEPPAEPSITPTEGGLGCPFTVTDPQGRIGSNFIAVFYPEGSGPSAGTIADNIVVSPDGTTLTGDVPQTLTEGVQHFVAILEDVNDASLFNDLPFLVTDVICTPPPADPSIDPDCGALGSAFTITDPQGRMSTSTVVIFTPEGSSPELGTLADNVVFSADGTTVTGNVPTTIQEGVQHFVSVHELSTEPSVFPAIPFLVPLDSCPSNDPSISPTSGFVGTAFTITDPQGRIQPGDIAVIYPEGSDPATGTLAEDVTISADGTTLTGTIPLTLGSGQHFISVRATINDPSLFNDLPFLIT